MSDENEQLIPTPGKFGENFLLERELGRGGMGGVYLGRDIMLDRPVAVKVMQKEYGEDKEFLARFRKEAQAAAKLIHPNIAQIYSYGVVDNMPYIAMELVAGGSLQQLMNNAPDGKTDIPRILKICEQVAQALRCAADQGLVHGDIKPENILLDANGNAKLVDFGLAGMQSDTDEIWGTPYYIAPEKLRKEVIDYRADMYNLGGTLYHALTGIAPFEGEDANAVVRRRFEGKPKKPSALRPEISPAIDELVMKMLELDKKNRFPTFEALLQQFNKVMTTGLTEMRSGKKGGGRTKLFHATRHMTPIHLKNPVATADADSGETPKASEGSEVPAPEQAVSPKASTSIKIDIPDVDDDNENVAAKMLKGVCIAVALVLALAGGITWYVISDKHGRAAEKQAMIVNKIAEARAAIEDTRRIAEKFGASFTDFAARATAECETATKRIAEAVPEVADRLKPEPSRELLDAIALTNVQVAVVVGTNGIAGVSNAMNQAAMAMAGAMQQAATQVATTVGSFQIKPFRPPNDDEADPASPEHEEYVKLKKAYMEEQKKLAKAAMEDPDKAAKERKEAARKKAEAEDNENLGAATDPLGKLQIALKKSELKFKRELQMVGEEAVADVNDLWMRAYSCQASVIKLNIEVRKVLNAATNAANYVTEDEACMQALAALSGEVTELYNAAKGSKEVENVQKGISYIKSKGAKSLKSATDNLFRRRAEHEREVKKIQYEIEKLEKEKRDNDAHLKLVADEQSAAKMKFDTLQQNKNFELLEWDAAIREIEFLKSNFKTAEGKLAADDQVKKVNAMKSVQEILSKNLKDFAFRKAKLGKLKATVRAADMKEIQLVAGTEKRNFKINWVKFYKDYHSNLNELLIHYIENGRKNCSPRLTLQKWGEAMSGAALTLRIICADDPNAATRGEQMAKNVAKEYPSYVKTLKMMFPEIEFPDAPEE